MTRSTQSKEGSKAELGLVADPFGYAIGFGGEGAFLPSLTDALRFELRGFALIA